MGCRQSTVIVKMAHDKGERIEVTSEGMLEEDVDDLIDEEPEEEMVIEEAEEEVVEEEVQHVEDTKVVVDTSLEDVNVEETTLEEEEVIAEDQECTRRKKKMSGKLSKPNTTKLSSASSAADSSFEDQAIRTKMVTPLTATPSPDHHARRPMNAFLIFCKKHRPIVREKYTNLENR